MSKVMGTIMSFTFKWTQRLYREVYFKWGANINSDSRMKWFDFRGQRSWCPHAFPKALKGFSLRHIYKQGTIYWGLHWCPLGWTSISVLYPDSFELNRRHIGDVLFTWINKMQKAEKKVLSSVFRRTWKQLNVCKNSSNVDDQHGWSCSSPQAHGLNDENTHTSRMINTSWSQCTEVETHLSLTSLHGLQDVESPW